MLYEIRSIVITTLDYDIYIFESNIILLHTSTKLFPQCIVADKITSTDLTIVIILFESINILSHKHSNNASQLCGWNCFNYLTINWLEITIPSLLCHKNAGFAWIWAHTCWMNDTLNSYYLQSYSRLLSQLWIVENFSIIMIHHFVTKGLLGSSSYDTPLSPVGDSNTSLHFCSSGYFHSKFILITKS